MVAQAVVTTEEDHQVLDTILAMVVSFMLPGAELSALPGPWQPPSAQPLPPPCRWPCLPPGSYLWPSAKLPSRHWEVL